MEKSRGWQKAAGVCCAPLSNASAVSGAAAWTEAGQGGQRKVLDLLELTGPAPAGTRSLQPQWTAGHETLQSLPLLARGVLAFVPGLPGQEFWAAAGPSLSQLQGFCIPLQPSSLQRELGRGE